MRATNSQSLGRQGDIRRALIEADLLPRFTSTFTLHPSNFAAVLPGQLFHSTQIPVCLWSLAKSKAARVIKVADESTPECLRRRGGETLFIDARKMGTLIDLVHRELTDADLAKIVDTYHAWRLGIDALLKEAEKVGAILDLAPPDQDIPGFCKSATTAEIAAQGHVLTPGRYGGAEEVEDDGEPFKEKMPRLVGNLEAQFAESAKLESAIRRNLAQFDFKP